MRLKSHSRDSYLTLYLSRLGDVTITRLPLETLGRLYCKASSKTLRGGAKTRCSVQLYGMSTARAPHCSLGLRLPELLIVLLDGQLEDSIAA